MGKGRASILIIARPERLREALRALLAPMPYLGTVSSVDNVPAALKTINEQTPQLVLLGDNLSDNEVKAALRGIKTEQPETHCIVLAHSTWQEQVARLAGADEVVLNGRPTVELLDTVARSIDKIEKNLLSCRSYT